MEKLPTNFDKKKTVMLKNINGFFVMNCDFAI